MNYLKNTFFVLISFSVLSLSSFNIKNYVPKSYSTINFAAKLKTSYEFNSSEIGSKVSEDFGSFIESENTEFVLESPINLEYYRNHKNYELTAFFSIDNSLNYSWNDRDQFYKKEKESEIRVAQFYYFSEFKRYYGKIMLGTLLRGNIYKNYNYDSQEDQHEYLTHARDRNYRSINIGGKIGLGKTENISSATRASNIISILKDENVLIKTITDQDIIDLADFIISCESLRSNFSWKKKRDTVKKISQYIEKLGLAKDSFTITSVVSEFYNKSYGPKKSGFETILSIIYKSSHDEIEEDHNKNMSYEDKFIYEFEINYYYPISHKLYVDYETLLSLEHEDLCFLINLEKSLRLSYFFSPYFDVGTELEFDYARMEEDIDMIDFLTFEGKDNLNVKISNFSNYRLSNNIVLSGSLSYNFYDKKIYLKDRQLNRDFQISLMATYEIL